MRRGISLVELLVAITIGALLTSAASMAFVSGLRDQSSLSRVFDSRTDRLRFEDTVQSLIAGADLHGDGSYFVSPVPGSLDGSPGDLGSGSSSLVWTTSAVAPSASYLTQKGQAFEDLNRQFGPVSDCAEVSLSLTPVGDAGQLFGLFLREQRPGDDDPTQGGDERLLEPDVKDIRFEFYDGSNWLTSWDSRNDQKGKLPSAVRVTYLLKNEVQPRSLLVRLPLAVVASQ